MTLVVDHDDEGVVAGAREHGIGAERPFGEDLRSLRIFDRRNDDVLLFRAEESVFAGMRIESRYRDARRRNADFTQGAMRRVNDMTDPLTGDQLDGPAY